MKKVIIPVMAIWLALAAPNAFAFDFSSVNFPGVGDMQALFDTLVHKFQEMRIILRDMFNDISNKV